jgi:hypothetical protein
MTEIANNEPTYKVESYGTNILAIIPFSLA